MDAYFEAMSGLTTTGATMISPKTYHPVTHEEISIYYTNPHVPNKTYFLTGTIPPIRDPETGLVLYSGVEAVSKAVLSGVAFLQWIGGMGIVVIFLTVLPALGVGGKFLYQMETTGPIKDGINPSTKQTASNLWKLYLSLTLLEIALLSLDQCATCLFSTPFAFLFPTFPQEGFPFAMKTSPAIKAASQNRSF